MGRIGTGRRGDKIVASGGHDHQHADESSINRHTLSCGAFPAFSKRLAWLRRLSSYESSAARLISCETVSGTSLVHVSDADLNKGPRKRGRVCEGCGGARLSLNQTLISIRDREREGGYVRGGGGGGGEQAESESGALCFHLRVNPVGQPFPLFCHTSPLVNPLSNINEAK